MIHLDEKFRKWIHFFQILDTNQDGVLEPVDIIEIANRLYETYPKRFDESEKNFIKHQMMKHFNRLLIDAKARSSRKITMQAWINMMKKNTDEGKVSQFIRWFCTSAVKFVFDLADHDRNGFIDFDEFEILCTVLALDRANILVAFNQLDANSDKKISKYELYDAIRLFFTNVNDRSSNYLFGQYQTLEDEYMGKLLIA